MRPASPNRHGRMLKRPYPPRAIALQSDSTRIFNQQGSDLNARRRGQAARRGGGCRRDIEDHAADAGRDDRRRADLAVHAGAGAAGAGDDVRRRHLGRADDGVALHGRHRLLAARDGAAVGQVRPPSGAARGPRLDGGGEHRLLAGADAAATDRRALPAGARRRHRHGGEPRHHPRSLQPRPHQLHDQPRHRGDDDGADAERAGRRPAGDRVRLARDLLFHHRGLDQRRGPDRPCAARDAPRARREQQLSRRCRQAGPRPRLSRLCAVPGAGVADHLHLCRRRTLHRGDADGPHHRRIRRVVRDDGICVSGRQSVLRPLRAAPFAGEADLVRAGAAIRRRAAEPDLQPHRHQPGADHGCSAPR